MNEWTGWSDEVNQVVCEPFIFALVTRLPVGSTLARRRPQPWMTMLSLELLFAVFDLQPWLTRSSAQIAQVTNSQL